MNGTKARELSRLLFWLQTGFHFDISSYFCGKVLVAFNTSEYLHNIFGVTLTKLLMHRIKRGVDV